MDDVVVGAFLRAARERADISPARAAAYLKLPETRIRRLEAGRAAWSHAHALALTRCYGLADEDPDGLERLLACEHRHVVADFGAGRYRRLAAVEARATRIRVASRTVPALLHGSGTPQQTGHATAPEQRRLPDDCPVTLLWDEFALECGCVDAPRTAARLRHLAAMVDAGVLHFRLLVPDFTVWSEPVGTELTLDTGPVVFADEQLPLTVTYSTGPKAGWKTSSLDRQLAAALSAEDSLAALHRAATQWGIAHDHSRHAPHRLRPRAGPAVRQQHSPPPRHGIGPAARIREDRAPHAQRTPLAARSAALDSARRRWLHGRHRDGRADHRARMCSARLVATSASNFQPR
ncbi:helix-turn-helix domain-containing protein [Streptomyces sp. TG1A-8]|uniref:helix-turn-helix domain-containing protein n=1 Tax=Streptomyces sp. TG1A-8 TaxID=3051385 RepID=UPI00265BDF71|nr:helix-turn-helix domain-containing protein [Streptomyces sp. TG1A-8]MDO0930113.1 helix-turn-helix domain-containing protein [Streptomyces sp. TG1A-8]